jgi:hypothetical protein
VLKAKGRQKRKCSNFKNNDEDREGSRKLAQELFSPSQSSCRTLHSPFEITEALA